MNSFIFLKVIFRCIKFKYSIIYCDESSLKNNNNNYIYCWRLSKENLYENLGPKKKIKLNYGNK